MDFKHEIIALKYRGDKNYVDENVSDHGKLVFVRVGHFPNEWQFWNPWIIVY